ncbi:hypothetical protein OK074_3092 [Actinobacteria bacterium OK074]|nr:hypothetical protein OK074_3092 [Actinobacteria bacterium OK074]
MTAISEDPTERLLKDTRPDAELSREEVVARNLAAVASHFHNENPMDIDKAVLVRRFATEEVVFDDRIIHRTVVDDLVPNLPYEVGDQVSVRLVHCFQMRDGRIAREIGYEVWREKDSASDHDSIPDDAVVQLHDPAA